MKAPAIYRTLCASMADFGNLGWQQYTLQTTHNRTQNCAHSSCVEKERLHAYTKQCTESYVNIYMCLFLLQIIIHIQIGTEREEFGWLWKAQYVQRITFFFGKIHYLLRTGFFIHHSTISAVNRVQLVSDMMSHIATRGCR
jgi:hypothetical protein